MFSRAYMILGAFDRPNADNEGIDEWGVCNFTEEEWETYRKMLEDNSEDSEINIFDLIDEVDAS